MGICHSANAINPSLTPKEAATEIQKVARGKLARIKLGSQKRAANDIQRVFRGFQSRMNTASDFTRLNSVDGYGQTIDTPIIFRALEPGAGRTMEKDASDQAYFAAFRSIRESYFMGIDADAAIKDAVNISCYAVRDARNSATNGDYDSAHISNIAEKFAEDLSSIERFNHGHLIIDNATPHDMFKSGYISAYNAAHDVFSKAMGFPLRQSISEKPASSFGLKEGEKAALIEYQSIQELTASRQIAEIGPGNSPFLKLDEHREAVFVEPMGDFYCANIPSEKVFVGNMGESKNFLREKAVDTVLMRHMPDVSFVELLALGDVSEVIDLININDSEDTAAKVIDYENGIAHNANGRARRDAFSRCGFYPKERFSLCNINSAGTIYFKPNR